MALRDWIIKDLGWKLFSLSLAVAIWATVQKIYDESDVAGPTVETTYRNLPVLVTSADGDVHNYHVTPDSVAVTVKGPGNVMEVLQARQIRVSADLTGLKSIPDEVPLEVSVPPGVTFVNIDPEMVGILAPSAPASKP